MKNKEKSRKELNQEKHYGNARALNNVSKQGKRIRIQFDIDYQGDKGIKIPGMSQTVPDMTLTVRQLLENHTRGKNSAVKVQQPLYFDTEIPTINDITDVDKYREHLQNRLNAVNDFIKKEQSEKEAEKMKKDVKKEIKKEEEKSE